MLIAMVAIGSLIAISTAGTDTLADLQDEGHHRAQDGMAAIDAAYTGASLYQVVADSIINRDLAASREDWAGIKKVSLDKLAKVAEIVDTDAERQWAANAQRALDRFIELYERQTLPLLAADDAGSMARIREVDGQLDEQARPPCATA